MSTAGPSVGSGHANGSKKTKRLSTLRGWSFSHRRRSPDPSSSVSTPSKAFDTQQTETSESEREVQGVLDSYTRLRVRDQPETDIRPSEAQTTRPRLCAITDRSAMPGRKWPASDEDEQVDSYSWVDPARQQSLRSGQPRRRRSSHSDPSSPTSPVGPVSRAIREASRQPLRIPPSPTMAPQRPGNLDPTQSYNLLLAYQSSYSSHSSGLSQAASPVDTPSTSTEGVTSLTPDPEWHDLVDPELRLSLGREEVKRQGLWWELIKGESEYVRDLRFICQGIIDPLAKHDPPLLTPETRLRAFISEVFSSIPEILRLHERMLERLLERQRAEWPLMTSATDILLRTFLEAVDQYEIYMKNFPFAETRVKRECSLNPCFEFFFEERRNDSESTRRRDISVFLSRPVSRLPRLLLILDAITQATPADHPDREEIPTVRAVLEGVLRSSQPGIENAEAKIKLWDLGETLMFRKGEIIELDIPDPKRTLVHAGYVFRRMRSETNWHGWQDLHAFLLDNFFLLTRDEEQGKHIVVSRPIHIDFLEVTAADGAPERRHDYINQARRRRSVLYNDQNAPERFMYPFTLTLQAGPNSRSYTLCVASSSARKQWKEKIAHAKAMRRYDVENNRTFAIHTISMPKDTGRPAVRYADTFSWLNREGIAMATAHSVWLGWRRDSHSYRELVRFPSVMSISSIAVVPDFGWILVVAGGNLFGFCLDIMLPTHDPATWTPLSRSDGVHMSPSDVEVAFVRIGTTKGRLMVLHASYNSRGNSTLLTLQEPIPTPSYGERPAKSPFRLFSTLTIPGQVTDVSFFKQTIAVITDRTIMIAEPGNTAYHCIPVVPPSLLGSNLAAQLTSGLRAMAMFQTAEDEFVLVYEWGACFATRYGEIGRNGAFIRWNISPTYVAYRPPYLLAFDVRLCKAEVRHVESGKMCEVLEWKGMIPIRPTREKAAVLVLGELGLGEVVETIPL